MALKPDKSARSARAFLNALAKACPVRITRLLTDNGTEFTDRLFGSRARAPTGTHEFDRLCQALGIEHRLTPPRHPQTNGMVERFNGRIADLLRTHHFRSSEDLEQTLHRYVTLYNHHLPQQALNAQTPVQALQDWYASKPELFLRKPSNRPGRDTLSTSMCPRGHAALYLPATLVVRPPRSRWLAGLAEVRPAQSRNKSISGSWPGSTA